jgi:hypothetical protein
MKTVRAKFFVKSIQAMTNGDPANDQCSEVKLAPVYGANADDANAQWSKYTPSGEISMLITNPAAVDQFDLGGEYFVDFTKA